MISLQYAPLACLFVYPSSEGGVVLFDPGVPLIREDPYPTCSQEESVEIITWAGVNILQNSWIFHPGRLRPSLGNSEEFPIT